MIASNWKPRRETGGNGNYQCEAECFLQIAWDYRGSLGENYP